MYQNVLIPTDANEGTEVAVDHALDITNGYGAAVHALYVADVRGSADHSVGHIETVTDDLTEEGQARWSGSRRARDAGVDLVTAIVRGEPRRTILDYADRNDVDLIVMGTRGKTGLSRVLSGSVTEKVVRHADVPVLTVQLPVDEA